MPRRLATMLLLVTLVAARVSFAADDDLFRRQVAPLLERRCIACHNETDRKGGLSLQTAAQIEAGGEGGAVVVPGKPDDSSLFTMVTGDKPDMPKNGKPLAAEQIAALRQWIADGARWPSGVSLDEKPAADTNWWSLHPLQLSRVPEVTPADRTWARSPIDRFIGERRHAQGLAAARPADRATLLRRLSFDLIGLPPAVDDVAEFVADPDPSAYERWVDRLLASPRYGERWARHWLDIVHYGDTHGYDKDKLRPNAWPYRDYVIRALNDDKPYRQFVEEQLAGDVLYPDRPEGITALGFIAAGPWDFISHAEVPETKTDGKIARNLDRDDMVVNTLNTFCSTTVQCARCHHHKFDPISMTDYYRLQAVFAALDRADRPYDADPAVTRQRAALQSQVRELTTRRQAVDNEFKRLGGEPLVTLDRRVAELTKVAESPPEVHPQYGYHSGIEPTPDRVKWVQVDLGKSTKIDRVVYIACWDSFNNIGAGFGFPVRFKIELSDDAAFQSGVQIVEDQTADDVPNPGTQPREIQVAKKSGRFVRFTATRLAPRMNDFIFALSELRVLTADGTNVAQGKPVTSLDSIEAGPRWGRANLVDGHFPVSQATASAARAELADVRRQRDELLGRVVPVALRTELEQIRRAIDQAEQTIKTLPAPQMVYAGTVYHGSGAFVGTGPSGGKPRPIHLLVRGDVRKPGREVGPGTLSFFTSLPNTFDLPSEAPEGARRAQLAHWVTHRENPLTWRSIVNRLWQYHFGRGIVESPSDFGRMGRTPSHPELLDYLAREFRDGSQSLKQLHRELVTTATYRQSSEVREEFARVDVGNVYLWRMNRRKLEAEAIRDSVLLVAGKMDFRMGGPGFQDFVIERPEHSPHYEYHLHDPDDPRSQRRSVYRFLVRSQPQPFMTTLDCADPSMSVDRRNETINALQALALLNNKLTVAMTRHFASRLEQATPDLAEQIRLAFGWALSRPPTTEEEEALQSYARQYGLANACRVILNLNEFAFVD